MKTEKAKWAIVVSRMFEPVLEIPVIITLLTFVWVRVNDRWTVFGWLFLTCFVLPMWYLWRGIKKGKIGDIDISKREERNGLFSFGVMCILVGVIGLVFLGEKEIVRSMMELWILGVIISIVTFWWKISAHGAMNTILAGYLCRYWGLEKWWWMWLVVVLVCVARVVLKKHTVGQVIAGVAVAGLVMVM